MNGKRVIIGTVVAAVLAGALTVAAVVSPDTEVMRILQGALSPAQLGALLEFRQAHQAERQQRLAQREDPAALWRQLALTEEQQDRLKDVAAMNVDELAFAVQKTQAGAAALRQAVFTGVPDSPALKTASAQLGQDLGDAAVASALALADARAILTPAQVKLIADQIARHDQLLDQAINAMPKRVDEAVDLWTTLALTPVQVDALARIHDLMPGIARNEHRQDRKEFRSGLADILDARQLLLVDRFHETNRPDRLANRQNRRRQFEQELALSGDQKIKLVNLLIGRREALESTAALLVAAGLDLRDQVLAVPTDEAAIRQSANRLAEVLGSSASLAAEIVTDARRIVSDRQFALIESAAAEHEAMIAQHLGQAPARVHKLIAFLDELALTPAQKNAIVDLVEKTHQQRQARFMRMQRAI